MIARCMREHLVWWEYTHIKATPQLLHFMCHSSKQDVMMPFSLALCTAEKLRLDAKASDVLHVGMYMLPTCSMLPQYFNIVLYKYSMFEHLRISCLTSVCTVSLL